MIDLAIIGAGPAGYVAAEKAAKAGLDTVLFEKKTLGGVCLNEGCIPTKTLLYSAKMYDNARHSQKYGITAEGVTANFGAIQKRKTKVVRKLTGGIKVRMREAGVQVVEGEAYIEGTIDGRGARISCNGEIYECRNLLICTGSQAAVPPIPGLEPENILTNREILELDHIPETLTTIGGGVIGMEFASFFCSMGTKVTVIEMLPEILGGLDPEISAMLRDVYAKKGVEFHLSCRVTSLEGKDVIYETPDGETCRACSEQVLLSVGRRATLKGYGLENLGVEAQRGIKVDSHMRTNIPGVYAAGDVTGFSLLAHTASREAEVAVADILGIDDEMSYDAIPGVVYTNPEVAGVGLTEQQALDRGIEYDVVKLPMQYSGRFVAENEGGEGICKILARKGGAEVLGVHMMGNYSSEIISTACLAVSGAMSVKKLLRTVLPHPSVSEILKETAGALV